jgi:hypothetical protein
VNALERLDGVVDFELFRADLERAVPRSDRLNGGRRPFDHVLTFETLVLQTNHNPSDERTEYLIPATRYRSCGSPPQPRRHQYDLTFRETLTRARIGAVGIGGPRERFRR